MLSLVGRLVLQVENGRAHCPQRAVVEGLSASLTSFYPAQSPGLTWRLEDQPPYQDAPTCDR